MLEGQTVLLTTGPTYEPLDPVRFIGNHSTGKMGYALAEAFAAAGARVHLISGPTNLEVQHPLIELVRVTTAAEMHAQCLAVAMQANIWVFAAAVSDYRPKVVATHKIKKNNETLTLELVKNVDIAATLGRLKKPGQLSVGFALETDREVEHARAKLDKKNFDLIVLNSLNDAGAGFRHDTNKVAVIERDRIIHFDLKSKPEVARDIVRLIIEKIHA